MSANYIESAMRADKVQVDAAYELINRVLPVFPRFFDTNQKKWRYSVPPARGRGAGTAYSFSTNAMIMFSLVVTTGMLQESVLVPTRVTGVNTDSLVDGQGDLRVEDILRSAFKQFMKASRGTKPKNILTTSPTFGKNWTYPASVDTFRSRSVLFSQFNLLELRRAQMS